MGKSAVAPLPGRGVSMNDRRCTRVTHGKRCGSWARKGKSLCFRHDPASAKEAAEASRRGGDNNRGAVLPDAADVDLKNTEDVRQFLCHCISQVRRGDLGVKEANCIGILTSYVMRAIEQGDVEKRLEALEEHVHGQR